MSIKEKLKKSAPLLLTAGTIGFTIGAVITAVKGKPKYDALMDNAEELARKEDREVTKKEKAIIFGRSYGPTVVCVAGSAACAIINEKVHKNELAKNLAEGAAAVAFVESKYKNYRELAEARMRPKDVDGVKDDLVKRGVEKAFDNVTDGSKVKHSKLSGPSDEDQYILDMNSGMLTYGKPDDIKKAHFNFVMKNFGTACTGDVPLRHWYIDVGIPVDFNSCKILNRMGWKEGHVPSTELRWTTVPVPNGPMAGTPVWAFMFDTDDEPEQIYWD